LPVLVIAYNVTPPYASNAINIFMPIKVIALPALEAAPNVMLQSASSAVIFFILKKAVA